MSLRHIEELTSALVEARSGNLSNTQFQIVVLEGLISLKESHVSLRSRLFNLQEDIDNQTQSEDQVIHLKFIYTSRFSKGSGLKWEGGRGGGGQLY